MKGNEALADLPHTANDAVNAKKIALRLGIPEQNIKFYTKQTEEKVKKLFADAKKRFITTNSGEKRSFLMVYVAGHGVCDQMQYFVLNNQDNNIIAIEDKLRSLAKASNTNILTFYDICRSDKSKFPNLKGGLEDVQAFADNYEYMHICTLPLQTVDAKSVLAEQTLEHLTKEAQKDANNLI